MKIAIHREAGSGKETQNSPSLLVKKSGKPSVLLIFQIVK